MKSCQYKSSDELPLMYNILTLGFETAKPLA